jgi:plasmid stabilization system protein ParE
MSRLPHRFDLEALAEHEDAARYYAAQQPGLEFRYIACIEDAIALICEAPERWRIFAGRDVRRALTRVFPYAILYTIDPDHVLIVAVAHYSREPGIGRTVSHSRLER